MEIPLIVRLNILKYLNMPAKGNIILKERLFFLNIFNLSDEETICYDVKMIPGLDGSINISCDKDKHFVECDINIINSDIEKLCNNHIGVLTNQLDVYTYISLYKNLSEYGTTKDFTSYEEREYVKNILTEKIKLNEAGINDYQDYMYTNGFTNNDIIIISYIIGKLSLTNNSIKVCELEYVKDNERYKLSYNDNINDFLRVQFNTNKYEQFIDILQNKIVLSPLEYKLISEIFDEVNPE